MTALLDMAKTMHVDVESLIGQPLQLAPTGGAITQLLDVVRQVMTHRGLATASLITWVVRASSATRSR